MIVKKGKPPRWYFSFRSPYSWLAYRDLVDRYPSALDQMQWRPFFEPEASMRERLAELGCSFPYVPMSREKHRYILADVRRLAAERGLGLAWPVDVVPRWEVAHLAYFVAEEAGAGRAFVSHVYRARWERGLDISDPETIRVIASRLGIDPGAAAGAADDPLLRDRGLRALADIHADGVFGVPFFAVGYDKYWGLERMRPFLARLREEYGSLPAAPLVAAPDGVPGPDLVPCPDPGPDPERALTCVSAGSADLGHAGGCG
jgi:2-hydroxychromene-2-carboxylate isomerase